MEHRDDPKKPYKMYAAMASAFLGSLLVGDIGLPVWAKAIITATLAALAVYAVKNPTYNQRKKKKAPSEAYSDEALF